jgi:hypothetical protein
MWLNHNAAQVPPQATLLNLGRSYTNFNDELQ